MLLASLEFPFQPSQVQLLLQLLICAQNTAAASPARFSYYSGCWYVLRILNSRCVDTVVYGAGSSHCTASGVDTQQNYSRLRSCSTSRILAAS